MRSAIRAAALGARPGRVFALILGAVGLVFVAANAHLLYVATTSQPDCVAPASGEAAYRAAKPAC